MRVNGDPGFIALVDGRSIGVISFEIRDGLITEVRAFFNLDKLRHLFERPCRLVEKSLELLGVERGCDLLGSEAL